jgi:hypothetical protein
MVVRTKSVDVNMSASKLTTKRTEKSVRSIQNITAIQADPSREDGEVSLGPSKALGAFRIDDNGQRSARAITMDTVMRETGIVSIDLLEVAIEGAEIEVFECCPWIIKFKLPPSSCTTVYDRDAVPLLRTPRVTYIGSLR